MYAFVTHTDDEPIPTLAYLVFTFAITSQIIGVVLQCNQNRQIATQEIDILELLTYVYVCITYIFLSCAVELIPLSTCRDWML